MTERKPPNVDFETWIDKQVREATERGELDDLPGTGKPLPGLDKPHDELWWIRQKVQREGLSTEALLPPSLQLRKEIERLPDTVGELRSEQAVRDLVEELNGRIVEHLRAPSSGPHVPVGPVDAEGTVQQWRAIRTAKSHEDAAATPDTQTAAGATSPRPTRWWHRFTRRSRKSD